MARKPGPRTSSRVPQTGQRQLHMSSPPRRSFGVPNALGIQHDGEISDVRDSSRQPRSTSWIRPNIFSLLTNHDEELGVKSPTSERPPIPSALHVREPDSTPLPALSMIVLSIVSVPSPAFYHGSQHHVDYAWGVLVCKRIDAILALHGQRYVLIQRDTV